MEHVRKLMWILKIGEKGGVPLVVPVLAEQAARLDGLHDDRVAPLAREQRRGVGGP